MLKTLRGFGTSESGVAATEFALVLPIFLVILCGFIELSYFTLVERRAEYASDFIADFLSQDTDDTLTTEEVDHIQLIWAISNPSASDVQTTKNSKIAKELGAKFNFSAIEFTPVNSGCAVIGCLFKANTKWVAENGNLAIGGHSIVCDLDIVGNTAPRDGKNVPVGMAGKGAVIKTNIAYNYHPLFSNGYISLSTKNRHDLRKTRSGNLLRFPPGQWRDRAVVTVC